MSFLAQIDLSEIGDAGPPEMPRHGILYFFLDERLLDGDEPGPCVLYAPEALHLVRAEPQARLPLIGEPDGPLYGGWAHAWQSAAYNPFPPDRFPKYEIDFVPFRDVEWDGGYSETIRAMAEAEWKKAVAGKLGPRTYVDERRYTAFSHGGLVDPRSETNPAIPLSPGISPLLEEWPQSWVFVGLHLMEFFETPRAYAKDRFPDCCVKEEFLSECRAWVREAREYGPFVPLTPQQRSCYREWVSSRYVANFKAWRNLGRSDTPEKRAHYAIWEMLSDRLRKSALDATTRCVDADQSNRDLISAAALKDFGGGYHSGHHQMFGLGENIQHAARKNRDNVLLLQLDTDYGMLWMFGDCGALQFWITYDDLAQRRFNRVNVTMECG